MATPFFSDIYKLFHYATKKDPYSQYNNDNVEGVGITFPDMKLNTGDINGNAGSNTAFTIRLSSNNEDVIDLQSTNGRSIRYKEYDKMETVPDVHAALNIFADEACIAGYTPVATPFGFIPIKELAETKSPTDRFLVYCYDFKKQDYTLGWGFNPRFVKNAPTVRVIFDDGQHHDVTPDHRFLMRDGTWKCAGDLKFGDLLMPFYRVQANYNKTKLRSKQFPRVFTFADGWKHERQFIDEWKLGDKIEDYERVNMLSRLIVSGLNARQVAKTSGITWQTVERSLARQGFHYKELKLFAKKYKDHRRVVGVVKHDNIDVYDLSVEEHENFATNSTIVHNCQGDSDGFLFKVVCANKDIKDELDFVMHKLWKMDDRLWSRQRNLCKMGDDFWELVLHPRDPKGGIISVSELPADTMYRIETIKGRLVEFQQSDSGPDYEALSKIDILKATDQELKTHRSIRFHPSQIVHARLGDNRKTFFPYGVSVLEAARGPAADLRSMEDAMLAYRIIRAPERRVFYVEMPGMSAGKQEQTLERMQSEFKKRKVYKRGMGMGASGVDERTSVPSFEEDIWVPIRPNSQTRIETLPGAQNLSEIDDALYFRQRLYTALQFPNSYLLNNDPQATRFTLSQRDTQFARHIERLQRPIEYALYEAAVRHLQLRGVPEELYRDLKIIRTPPSDHRRAARNEIEEIMYNRAATMMGSKIYSHFDILTKILDKDEETAKEMVSRMKAQNIEDLKLQVIASNPDLFNELGIVPNQSEGPEVGTTPEGENPEIAPDDQQGLPPDGSSLPPTTGNPDMGEQEDDGGMQGAMFPEPSEEDIKKYNLDIDDRSKEIDHEEIDRGESEDYEGL